MSADVHLYTLDEAAAILKITKGDVRRLYRTGQLAALRLAGTPENPRKLRFTLDSLQSVVTSFQTYDPKLATRGAA